MTRAPFTLALMITSTSHRFEDGNEWSHTQASCARLKRTTRSIFSVMMDLRVLGRDCPRLGGPRRAERSRAKPAGFGRARVPRDSGRRARGGTIAETGNPPHPLSSLCIGLRAAIGEGPGRGRLHVR